MYRSLDEKVKSYQGTYKKFGDDPRSLQYNSARAASVRYEQLLADIDVDGKTILDVGCGFGDLIPFINSKTKSFDYLGIDIMSEFIKVAQKKYPKYKFLTGDYLGHPLSQKFDVIFCSGSLNSNIIGAESFRRHAIKNLFNHANYALSFNLTGSCPQPENKKAFRVYYSNSLEILMYCLGLTRKVILRQHYKKKDFTVVMFK